MLTQWNHAATGGLQPDLTLLFDIAHEAGLKRRNAAPGDTNRLDREPAAFHARVRARFLELAAADPARFQVIDATASVDALESVVWAAVETRLPAPVRPGDRPA